MSRMSELSMVVDELRNAAMSLHTAADTLADLLSTNDETPMTSAEPTPVTLEEVRAILAEKSVQGHTAQVQAMIHKHGAEKLSQVDTAEYAGLMAEAEAL